MKKETVKKILFLLIGIVLFAIPILLLIFQQNLLQIIPLSNKSLNELINIMFSSLMVVAGVWITYYFLFIQMYRDRYSVKIMDADYIKGNGIRWILIVYSIVLGFIVLLVEVGIIVEAYFCLISLATIISILYKAYRTNKDLMIKKYIDKLFDNIKEEIDTEHKMISSKTIVEIKQILEECIIKEEYYVVQNIISKISDTFEIFMENALKIQSKNSEDIDEIFEEISDLNIEQLIKCETVKSKILSNKIIKIQVNNMEQCIKGNQKEFFLQYLNSVHKRIYVYCIENKSESPIDLNYIYINVINSLLDENRENWIEDFNKEVREFIINLIHNSPHLSIREYVYYIKYILKKCSDKEIKDETIKENLMEDVNLLSFFIENNPAVFRDVQSLVSILLKELIESDINFAIKFYNSFFDNKYQNINIKYLAQFQSYSIMKFIEYAKDNTINSDTENTIYRMNLEYLDDMISSEKTSEYMFIMPDFHQILVTCKDVEPKIDEVLADIYKLLNKTIINKHTPLFYNFLKYLNKLILSFKKNDRNLQDKLFDVYFNIINYTSISNENQFGDIAFKLLEDLLIEMDNEQNISEATAKKVMNRLHEAGTGLSTQHEQLAQNVIFLISRFFEEQKEIRFVASNKEVKKKAYTALQEIGVSSIENDQELTLRKVSNALGWIIKKDIDNNASENVENLLNRANELYCISKKMEVSVKTRTFMLTLFTTIGVYACSSGISYLYRNIYLDLISEFIKDEEMERIHLAIDLRMIDETQKHSLFGSNPKSSVKQFLTYIENHRKKKDKK